MDSAHGADNRRKSDSGMTSGYGVLGFSLLEVIFALVAASILSLVYLQLIGGNFIRSTEPIQQLDDGYELKAIMENITAHYKELLLNAADPLATLNQDVTTGNDSGSDPFFGAYTSSVKYLTFSAGVEEASPCSLMTKCNVLKITIERNGQSLTTLFSR